MPVSIFVRVPKMSENMVLLAASKLLQRYILFCPLSSKETVCTTTNGTSSVPLLSKTLFQCIASQLHWRMHREVWISSVSSEQCTLYPPSPAEAAANQHTACWGGIPKNVGQRFMTIINTYLIFVIFYTTTFSCYTQKCVNSRQIFLAMKIALRQNSVNDHSRAKLHTLCKITHHVKNYTPGVKSHTVWKNTMCKITHPV